MSDLISRQAVLSLAKDVILEGGVKHRCIDATMIHELPTAQPAPRWIPVNERLPEDGEVVLITMDDSITVRGKFFEQISNELGFFKEGVWHWGYEIGECYWPETTHVTAWMPLPEPYKEENR